MSMHRLRQQLKKQSTENAEKNAVQTELRKNGHSKTPHVTQGKTEDGRLVRMYLWRSTPMGNLCLVSGPDVEAELHELFEVEAGDPTGDLYFPAKGRHPALTELQQGARTNPKKVWGKEYVHRTALADLSSQDQKRVQRAAQRAGNPRWTVARVDPTGTVMLGRTESWDRANPALLESWTVKPRGKVQHRTYNAGSRPVYHKTEQMRKQNPGVGDGGTAIVRKGPSSPVKWLEKRDMIRSPVLDFGSGHGEDAAWLRSKGYTVREYDPNFEGVHKKPTGKYNTVLCTYVLNVLPKSQQSKIMGEVKRLLRPTGDAYFTVRGDIKRAGKTSRGYQRPVSLQLPVVASPGGSPIYGLCNCGHLHRSNPAVGLPPRDSITKSDYPAIFGDFDEDGYLNADDPQPFSFDHPSTTSIEEVRLADEIEKLIEVRGDFVDVKNKLVRELKKMGGTKSKALGRVKSPFSILNKLRRKRLGTLTDVAATMLVVPNFDDVKRARDRLFAKYEILESDDYYTTPQNGYRAYHVIAKVDGIPVEIQLKTNRMKEISELSHHAYKLGTLDAEYMDFLTELAHRADTGDRQAANQIDSLLASPHEVEKKLSIAPISNPAYNYGDEPDEVYAESHLEMIALILNGIASIELELERGYDREGERVSDYMRTLLTQDILEFGEMANYHIQALHTLMPHDEAEQKVNELRAYFADMKESQATGGHYYARGAQLPLVANPQARVGKVRTHPKTGEKYVLWRPVLSDGSRPRVYLDADKPRDAELVDIMEAAEQLDAGKRQIEKRVKKARKEGKRGIFKQGTGRKIIQAPAPRAKPMLRASSATPIFDSEGKEYRATYAVIPTLKDGTGPVLASNLPGSYGETPGYPRVFQARSLQRLGEKRKIDKIAKNLDPDRVLLPHADATFGTPVVWEGDGKTHRVGDVDIETPKGVFYTLGGNGRLMAILSAPTNKYLGYVQRAESLWPDVWPKTGSPRDHRNVLVRIATKPNGEPLTFAQARTLAGRTQKAASGEESPIGKALSLIRSLGIERVSDLPRFIWKGIITQDNVEEFQGINTAFALAVFDAMGKARAESYQQDPALLANLFNDIMVGYLPRRFQLQGFVSEKQERALLSALPIVVSIHQGVAVGDVQEKWDLFPLLDAASRFAQAIKNKSDTAAIKMVEAAASQVQFGEGSELADQFRSLFDELPILGVLFGLVLKKGERARDPAITIEKYLVPYATDAFSAAESAVQSGLFAARGAPDAGKDPADVLATELGISLPRRMRETTVQQTRLIANRKGQLRLRVAGSRSLEKLYQRGPTPFAVKADGTFEPGITELLEKGLAEKTQCIPSEQTVYQRDTCTIRLTKRGLAFAKNRRRAERTHAAARQGKLWNPKAGETGWHRGEEIEFTGEQGSAGFWEAKWISGWQKGERTWIAPEAVAVRVLEGDPKLQPKAQPAVFRTLREAYDAASKAGVGAKSEWDFRQSYAVDIKGELGARQKGWAVQSAPGRVADAHLLATDGSWVESDAAMEMMLGKQRYGSDKEQGEQLRLFNPHLIDEPTPKHIAALREARWEDWEPHALPFEMDRYFTSPAGSVEVPLSQLKPIRARPKGVANANRFMWLAYWGAMDRRKPITLRDDGDGTYTVLDGNSTYANAELSGWPFLRGQVVERKNRSGQTSLGFDSIGEIPVLYFASGSNSPGEIKGFSDLGKPMGASFNECREDCIYELIEAMRSGLPVFLDSGAFSEVRFRKDQPPVVVSPIEDKDWEGRFKVYRRLADAGGELANVVAPDRVGDQKESLRRLAHPSNRKAVSDLLDRGASVLVPLQLGELPLAQYHARVDGILGRSDWIPALPFKNAATSPNQLREYLQATRPERVHLLGLGPQSSRSPAVAQAIRSSSPETKIQMDSVLIKSHVGTKRRKTGERRGAVTKAQHDARAYLRADRDSTDIAQFPSLWASDAALKRIAKATGLSTRERKELLAEPDAFFQKDLFYLTAEPFIEQELAKRMHGYETYETKRRGVREGLSSFAGPDFISNPDEEEDGFEPGLDSVSGVQFSLFGGAEYDAYTAPPGRVTVLNMGLGRDSLTMICLLAQGELVWNGKKHGPEDVDAVVFADVGNEWKHTYDLIPRVEAFSKKHGIRFLNLRKPQKGTPTGDLLDEWFDAMTIARKEAQAGWTEEYQRVIAPMYVEKDRQADALRDEKNRELKERRKQLKAAGVSTADRAPILKAIRDDYNGRIEELKKEAKNKAAKHKAEFGAAFKAERAWWAPKGAERRRKYDTIEARAAAGVYHLRPELLVDFASKGTIPLRSDKSCTGNHKVAPIRKVTEDLAIEKFGRWAQNKTWSDAVKKGIREPHLNLIGLAADETDRVAKGGDIGCFNVRYTTEAYPLVEMGIGKPDEQPYLDACGFGDVRKSGCWMCPYQPLAWWWALSVLHPEKFKRAEEAEHISSLRDPKLYFIGRQRTDPKTGKKVGVPLSVAVKEWRDQNPDADPHEVLEKQYSKCAIKFPAKKNPTALGVALHPDTCCPECERFVELWNQYGIPDWLQRSEPIANRGGLFDKIGLPERPSQRGQRRRVADDRCPPLQGVGGESQDPMFVYDGLWNEAWEELKEIESPLAKTAKKSGGLPTASSGKKRYSGPTANGDITFKEPGREIGADGKARTVWQYGGTLQPGTQEYNHALAELREMHVGKMPGSLSRPLFDFVPDLDWYDLIVVNSSGGKDSQAMMAYVNELATEYRVRDRVHVIHCDLGEAEHAGTRELVELHAKEAGLPLSVVERTVRGEKLSLLERFEDRLSKDKGNFPGFGTRYCTSEFKTGEVNKWVNAWIERTLGKGDLIKKCGRRVRVLNILGLRAEESDMRAKKGFSIKEENDTRKITYEWYPIQGWKTGKPPGGAFDPDHPTVWDKIAASGWLHHPAYDLGFARLSCTVCPLASEHDVALGAMVYPDYAGRIMELEAQSGKAFKETVSLTDIVSRLSDDPRLQSLAAKARGKLKGWKPSPRSNPGMCPLCQAAKIAKEPRENPTEVQSLMFDVSVFSKKEARSWAARHGFAAPKTDTIKNYHRLRQESPTRYRKGTFRTIELAEGVKAVVGAPK